MAVQAPMTIGESGAPIQIEGWKFLSDKTSPDFGSIVLTEKTGNKKAVITLPLGATPKNDAGALKVTLTVGAGTIAPQGQVQP